MGFFASTVWPVTGGVDSESLTKATRLGQQDWCLNKAKSGGFLYKSCSDEFTKSPVNFRGFRV